MTSHLKSQTGFSSSIYVPTVISKLKSRSPSVTLASCTGPLSTGHPSPRPDNSTSKCAQAHPLPTPPQPHHPFSPCSVSHSHPCPFSPGSNGEPGTVSVVRSVLCPKPVASNPVQTPPGMTSPPYLQGFSLTALSSAP